jgi:hypothetical protein
MNIINRYIVAVVLALLSTNAVAQTPLDRYADCVTPIVDHWTNAMNQAAILYPRFGIAWTAQKNTIEAAVERGDTAASEKAHEQFLDRMLRTAEPEAIQFYNLMNVAMEQAVARCGPVPKVSP